MSWQSWVARIGGYAAAPWTGGASIPIGEAIAQGINANEGVDKAVGQQGAATASANQRLDAAGGVNKQVFDSQRRDFQSLANAPYQSLAQMSGIDIPNITPLSVSGGVGPGASPMLSGTLGSVTPAANPDSLRQKVVAPLQNAVRQTVSGYGGQGVRMRAPDGQVFMIPHNQREEALANGGQELG